MLIKQFIFALGLIYLGLNTEPASAQAVVPCGQRTEIIQQLNNKYLENPISMGLTSEGAVIEIFASKDRTFTIIVTQPTGISCLVASGGNWENLNTALAGFKI